jgi:adenine deaminase
MMARRKSFSAIGFPFRFMKKQVVEGNYVDVVAGEIFPAHVSVVDGKIWSVNKVDAARDQYILPGLIDAHIHIESSLLTPSRFAEAAVPHGTTAVIADPRDIANVIGIDGVRYMLHDAKGAPMRFFFTAPSCVPMPREPAGVSLEWEAVQDLMALPECVALGEVLNIEGVLNNNEELAQKLEVARAAGRPIDGHAPGLSGYPLNSYILAGISTDHECSTTDEAMEKYRKGMKIMVREGSAAKNMDALLPFAKKNECCFVTDDLRASDLRKGHMDLLLAKAVAGGVDPLHAIKAVTVWPAAQYGLPAGTVEDGRPADLVVVKDLKRFEVLEVWIAGIMVAKDGRPLFEAKPSTLPVAIAPQRHRPVDFEMKSRENELAVEIVELVEAPAGRRSTEMLKCSMDTVQPDVSRDLLRIALVSRYKDILPSVGFVRGFGLNRGAMASSKGRHAHNIIVVGVDPESMALVTERVVEKGGFAATDGVTVVELPLPIAGLMSNEPPQLVAGAEEQLDQFVKGMGCRLSAPFLTLSLHRLAAQLPAPGGQQVLVA